MIEKSKQHYEVLVPITCHGALKSLTIPQGYQLSHAALHLTKMNDERYIRNMISEGIIKKIASKEINKEVVLTSKILREWKNNPDLIDNTLEEKAILNNPQILNHIVKEISQTVAGEEDTIRFIFLSICNIWVKNRKKIPHVFVNSKSSSGKSYLCSEILKHIPPDRVVYKSRISKTALTYLKSNDPTFTWDGKILYLEDVSEEVLNSDVHKVFLSEGQKETTVTIKAGVVMDFKVKGQPLEITTTAESEPKIEIVNRYNHISLDETSEQSKKINDFTAQQYETGEKYQCNYKIPKALKLLKNIKVKIPFASKISSYFPISNVKVRRDFPRFLELICCSATLHQYQREKDHNNFFLSTKQDYENARFVMQKMKLSEKMVNLSPTEEEMLDVCKKHTDKSIGVSQITGQEEIKGFIADDVISDYTNVSERYWYKTLKKFASSDYGLIKINLNRIEGVKKPVRNYQVKEDMGIFILPEYEKIIK